MAIFPKKQNARKTKIQGSRRSPLNSYYRSETNGDKASPFSKKPPERRARKYLFGLLDILLLALILLGLGYSLMIKPDANVIASSVSFHKQAEYQAAAAAQLRHISNRNKITLNEQALTSALIEQFPEISAVQVELPLLSEQPTIRLTISKASFILNSQGNRYIVASSGRAIAKAKDLPVVAGLPEINDQSGFKTLAGRQVFSAASVDFINTITAQFRRARIPIASLNLPAIPQELNLKTKDQPYFVKFYLGGDALTQAGQFLAARQHFMDTHQPPSQYLDVRVSGKIFFR